MSLLSRMSHKRLEIPLVRDKRPSSGVRDHRLSLDGLVDSR